MPKTLLLPSTRAWINDRGLLGISANSYFSKERSIQKPQLLLLPDMQIENKTKLAEFCGQTSELLFSTGNLTFLGLDNKLMVSTDLSRWRKVLETENRDNVFWHIVAVKDGSLFVQEYGEPTTGIYRSIDGGETWKKIAITERIDRKARHFHCIAYDQFRDSLIVTLGDKNRVKIAVSTDQGETWAPVYTSAYQCLPIEVTKEHLVFGMDSAISNGVIVWDPSSNFWQHIHLRYSGQAVEIGNMQCSDLKRLENGVWMMSTGGGSILYSNDLRQWRLSIVGKENQFEAHTMSNEKEGIVAVSMCDSTVIIDSKELTDTSKQVEVQQYQAFLPRMKGFGYVLKRFPFLLNATIGSGSRE